MGTKGVEAQPNSKGAAAGTGFAVPLADCGLSHWSLGEAYTGHAGDLALGTFKCGWLTIAGAEGALWSMAEAFLLDRPFLASTSAGLSETNFADARPGVGTAATGVFGARVRAATKGVCGAVPASEIITIEGGKVHVGAGQQPLTRPLIKVVGVGHAKA